MIDAALVGAGRWGQSLVESVQGKSDRIRFVRAVARTPAKVEAWAKEKGLTLGADYEAALKDPAVKAVVLATPHTQHAEQIAAAARAGKHVFVEKPFTLDRASARAAMEECETAKIAVGIGFNRRFMPAFRELKRMIDAGELGTLLHVEGNASGNLASLPPENWRANRKESPGGGMTSLAIHLMDAMIWMLGPIRIIDAKSIKRVAPIDMDDTTSMLITFVSGATGYLGTVAATPFFMNFRVFGSKGWAQLVDNNTLVKAVAGPPAPGTNPYASKPETVTLDSQASLKDELEAFADAAEGKAPFPISREEILHGVSAFQSMLDSVRRGSPCSVD
jgi:predicted dehydrogenase